MLTCIQLIALCQTEHVVECLAPLGPSGRKHGGFGLWEGGGERKKEEEKPPGFQVLLRSLIMSPVLIFAYGRGAKAVIVPVF